MSHLSLKKLFLWLALTCVFLLFLLILAAIHQMTLSNRVTAASENRYRSYLLADELRQSSDDLTRLARTYVVTGEDKWEEQYFQVLAIRNGEAPRPQEYHRIYWDFLAADQPSPRPAERTIALRNLMEQAGFTAEEFAKLEEAENNSNTLVQTETVAMNAVKGLFEDDQGRFTVRRDPDPAWARELMHDQAYHDEKAKIMQPVDEFFVLLDERTAHAMDTAQRQARRWLIGLMGLIGLTLATLLAGLWFAYQQLRRTIGGEPELVAHSLQQITDGDLSRPLDEAPADSIMTGAEVMRQSLVRAIASAHSTAEIISASVTQLHSSSDESVQRIHHQQQDVTLIAQSMNSMLETLRHVIHTVQQVTDMAIDTDRQAQEGATTIDANNQSMTDVAHEIERIAQMIVTLETDSQAIYQVVEVINAIAEQTHLLALNATIEAARAGEHGRGFAVVADEVRSLASRTQSSTNEIQAMIERLQHSAQTASGAMTQGLDQVQTATSQADQAGHAFSAISTAINQLKQTISTMAQKAQQQETSAEQIRTHINSISDSIGCSVADTQTLNQAAEELMTSARNMIHDMERFRLPKDA